jgi:hypothetical protein
VPITTDPDPSRVTGEYDSDTLALMRHMRRHGKPVAAAAEPIVDIIETPPGERLSAFVEGRRIRIDGRGFDPHAARQLAALTRTMLAGR